MKPDAIDYIVGAGFCAMTAGLYLLWGAPVVLLVDGALLLSLAVLRS